MPAAFVQAQYDDDAADPQVTLTVGAGNQLLAFLQCDGNFSTVNFSDTQANSWTQLDTGDTSPSVRVYRCDNPASGSTTFTYDSTGAAFNGLLVVEISGGANVDEVIVGGSITDANPITDVSAAATGPGLAVAFVAKRAGGATTCDGAWTEIHEQDVYTNVCGASAYKSVTAGGVTHQWTADSSNYRTAIVIIADAGGGGEPGSGIPFVTSSIARRVAR